MPKIYVIATPIGNLSDLSTRAIEILKSSDIIAAEDTRNTQKLLNHFEITTMLTSYHKFNEINKSKELVDKIIEDDLVLSIVSDAGTPCISDPGAIIIDYARENNIEIIAVPGPCAAIAALSISGFIIDEFTFYGFLNRKKEAQIKELISIYNKSKISIFYESPKRIKQLVENINFVDFNAKICLCNDLTKYYEKSIVDTPENIIEYLDSNINADKGEYCIVVKWSDKNESKINSQDKISTEALILDLIIKDNSRESIFDILQEKGYKRNQIYKAFENLKKFNYKDYIS